MSWDDLPRTEAQLSHELATLDWHAAANTSEALIARIHAESDLLPDLTARRILQKLRRKRRFSLMGRMAEALLHSGQDTPHIRRQYAQALIDLGITAAPELVLDTLLTTDEAVEASGLTGRIYKQLYVDLVSAGHRPNGQYLERAYRRYLDAYSDDPTENLWHGINAVALLVRGVRDGVKLTPDRDVSELAHEILATVDARERSMQVSLPPWDLAIRLEALLALARHIDVEATTQASHTVESAALEYAASGAADAFEIASTLRQLTEVWQLVDDELPGLHVLPILRAALLRREGGAVQRTPSQVRDEIGLVDEARQTLEKVFGNARIQPLWWLKQGFERCASVARIERRDGKRYGSGWIVDAGEFFRGQERRLMVLTNTHVVSPNGYPKSLSPSEARVHFEVHDTMYDVGDVFWSSPVEEFDAAFLSIKGDPPLADPLPIEAEPVIMTEPAPKLYIIGHPGGRGVSFSLEDNHLLACNQRVLHYRTPTEPGSSGSPVFEQDDWKVVALHHAGDHTVARIDGTSGTYEANVGIAIRAIQAETLNG